MHVQAMRIGHISNDNAIQGKKYKYYLRVLIALRQCHPTLHSLRVPDVFIVVDIGVLKLVDIKGPKPSHN